jgi:putative ABC transport system permease protein
VIDLDRWQEILETIRAGKLRTAATALSVAWGIFMLVILLGAGKGIQNGAEHSFRDDAVNSLWLYSGQTSIPHAGYGRHRQIRFTDDDYDALLATIPEIESISGRFYLSGEFTVKYGDTVSSFDVRACHPGHQFLENTAITHGRFLNDADLAERRKVAVIGPRVIELLFASSARGRKDPIGEWIDIRGTPYRVVGTYHDTGGDRELSKIYVPITTARTAFGGGDRIHQLMFTVQATDSESSLRMADQTRRLLAARHDFSVDDDKALRIRNNLEMAEQMTNLFGRIRIFIWIVGVGTIVAGIVGVSNIMLIAVRERTREIGIRKALGATPSMIVRQIVLESLVITGVSGYVGLFAGLGALELFNLYVPPTDYLRNPEANLWVVAGATALLVVSGLLAGYFPARLAARVQPVEALRAE